MNQAQAIEYATANGVVVTTDTTDSRTGCVKFKVGEYVVSRSKYASRGKVWFVTEDVMTFCKPNGGALRLTRGDAIQFAVYRIVNMRMLGM